MNFTERLKTNSILSKNLHINTLKTQPSRKGKVFANVSEISALLRGEKSENKLVERHMITN